MRRRDEERSTPWILLLLVVAVLLVLAYVPLRSLHSNTQPEPGEIIGQEGQSNDLLEYVMLKQEAARDSIQSFRITTNKVCFGRSTRDGLSNVLNYTETAIWIQRGKHMHLVAQRQCDGDLQRADPANAGPFSRLERLHLAMNDDYVAHWQLNNDVTIAADLTVDEHDSLDKITRRGRGARDNAQHDDILDFGFGLGQFSTNTDRDSSLRTVNEHRPEGSRWTAERAMSDGHEVFLLKFLKEKSGDIPVSLVTIDPTQGFLTTSVTTDSDPGSEVDEGFNLHWTVKGQEVAPGVWFPTEVIESSIRRGYKSSEEKKMTLTAVVDEINQPIPDKFFTWQSLGYPGRTAFRRDKSGKSHYMRIMGDTMRAHEHSPYEKYP